MSTASNHWAAIEQALGALTSCARSKEPWTPAMQNVYDNARAAVGEAKRRESELTKTLIFERENWNRLYHEQQRTIQAARVAWRDFDQDALDEALGVRGEATGEDVSSVFGRLPGVPDGATEPGDYV